MLHLESWTYRKRYRVEWRFLKRNTLFTKDLGNQKLAAFDVMRMSYMRYCAKNAVCATEWIHPSAQAMPFDEHNSFVARELPLRKRHSYRVPF